MTAASVAMQTFQAGITAIPDGDNLCIVQLLEKLLEKLHEKLHEKFAATQVRG